MFPVAVAAGGFNPAKLSLFPLRVSSSSATRWRSWSTTTAATTRIWPAAAAAAQGVIRSYRRARRYRWTPSGSSLTWAPTSTACFCV